jgi:hypothetical protein
MTTTESDHDGSTIVADKRDDTVPNGNANGSPDAPADAESQVPTIRHPREGMAPWKWPCTLAGFCLYLILNGMPAVGGVITVLWLEYEQVQDCWPRP